MVSNFEKRYWKEGVGVAGKSAVSYQNGESGTRTSKESKKERHAWLPDTMWATGTFPKIS